MANKTYYILSDPKEIQINKYLSNLDKYANKLNSVNYLYALRSVCSLLRESQNLLKDLDDIQNNLYNFIYVDDTINSTENEYSGELISIINELKLHKNDIYWDKDYKFSSFSNFINRIKNNLNTIDESIIQELLEADTLINENINNIISTNDDSYNNISQIKLEIINLLNSDTEINNKYESKYQSILDKISNFKNPSLDILKNENNIINALNGKKVSGESDQDDNTSNKPYIVIVGSHETLEQKINKLVNNINSLYDNVIDTTVIDAQQLYAQIINNFMTAYNSTEQNKQELLNSLVDTMTNSSQLSDDVKELVRSYVSTSSDPLYMYSESDKSEIDYILNSITNTLNMVYNTNSSLLDEINDKREQLTALENQYRDEHAGISYEHQPIDENITNQGNISNKSIENINKIYSKQVPHISRIITDVNRNRIDLFIDKEYIINVSYVPKVHQPFESDTLDITLSNNNIIEVIENTIDKIKIKALAAGSTRLTIGIDNKTTSITINSKVEPVITDNLFYFGHDESVITGDNKINTGFTKFKHISSVNDIIGKYYTGDQDKMYYLVMPYEYWLNCKVVNSTNWETNFNNRSYNDEINGTQYIILKSDEGGVTGNIYLIPKNHTADLYENKEMEFDIIVDAAETFKFYFGNDINVFTDDLQGINEGFDKFIEITEFDNVTGEYNTTTNAKKNLYLIIPAEMGINMNIKTALNNTIEFSDALQNLKHMNIDNCEYYAITIEDYSAQLVYITYAGDDIDAYTDVKKDSFDYSEYNIAVTGVELDRTSMNIAKGSQPVQLVANILPANATNKNVTWTSSDSTKVNVNNNGLIIALDNGEVDITVTTEDGAFQAVCHITVLDEVEETYYWYVGTTLPTDPTNLNENEGNNMWTSLGSTLPTTDIKVSKEDTNFTQYTWYIAAPTDANFTLYNATNAASSESGYIRSTFNIGSISYTLWTSKNISHQAVGYLHK